MSHYFQDDPNLAHDYHTFSFTIFGRRYTLQSDSGVFNKDGLDDGSRLLLETISKVDLGSSILDMGCGVGPLGLVLASLDPNRHVTLSDVNPRALACCKANAASLGLENQVEVVESDVYESIPNQFTTIVTNPPIRAGKKVTYAIYKGAVSHLHQDGCLVLVIRKKQGADSCRRYLETLFPRVEELASKKGYKILIAYQKGAN